MVVSDWHDGAYQSSMEKAQIDKMVTTMAFMAPKMKNHTAA